MTDPIWGFLGIQEVISLINKVSLYLVEDQHAPAEDVQLFIDLCSKLRGQLRSLLTQGMKDVPVRLDEYGWQAILEYDEMDEMSEAGEKLAEMYKKALQAPAESNAQ